MDKRLAKRHKRQVTRERERIRISEPDVRTPEEIKAAREASKPADRLSVFRNNATPAAKSPKADQDE